ncbi:MAG TPA: cobalamin-dependent protein [Acidobacteriota bacterium]|jgi:radical SAM superfamily enzyme YgiQ (UPF0313 family)
MRTAGNGRNGERRIALACMTPVTDANETGSMEMPSYGVKRVLAAAAADPGLKGTDFAFIDFRKNDVDAYVDAIVDFEADLVGFSVYLWSSILLTEVARRVKQRRPDCTIVFGGPSARTALFDLPPYDSPVSYLDAVVESEGETTFCEIARQPELNRAALGSVGGLHLPTSNGWIDTGPRTPIADLDQIASPFQLGLMPDHSVAYLETYRGCPMSCAFCEWGRADNPGTVFSQDYIAAELAAYAAADVPAVFLVDAGLNLNAKAFRNLAAAERQVGFLRRAGFWCEVYPSLIKDEQMEFLGSVGGSSYLGIGLQSLDDDVLRALQRPFKRDRFETVVHQLAPIADAEIQIIFGLPTDSPDGFRRTLEYALSFPASVRAYHCLVLPDALLTRSLPEWDVQFDPRTLEMVSCAGWSYADLQQMRGYLGDLASSVGGSAGQFWWHLPPGA